MAYQKMTLADFKEKLKGGQYKDATGARRGAGKADLSKDEKEQAYKAIDKHFGDSATKKAPAKKEKATSKRAAKKAASNGKAAHANGVSETKKAASGPGRGRKRSAEATVSSEDSAALAMLHLANERIGTISQAIDAMKRAKEAYPDLDTEPGMVAAAGAVTDIVKGVHDSLKGQLELPAMDPTVIERLAQTAPAAQGIPGQTSPVQVPPTEVSHEVS